MGARFWTFLERDLRRDTLRDAVVEALPQRIAETIGQGICLKDPVFDQFLPVELRIVSWQFWTPIVVAMRAANWLEECNVQTVVDIGSGVGKFCVVAALANRCRYVGVEQRSRLVEASRKLARLFEVDNRVSFVHGTFGAVSLPAADAYYLYNPFFENLHGAEDHLDEDVEHSRARYFRDIASTMRLLHAAPIGTYLLTYNGFGGTMPKGFEEVRVDRELPNVLRLWKKTKHERAE